MSPAEEFDAWWAVYPLHVAKLAAKKAWPSARKSASFQQLVDGVQRYIRGKPSYADWCHAATWLRAGRWDDEYDTPAPRRGLGTASDWGEECKQIHGGTCTKRWDHEMLKRDAS